MRKCEKDAERYRWLPIETAPTGVLVLLFQPHLQGGFMFFGFRPADDSAWYNNLNKKEQRPTLWMPADHLLDATIAAEEVDNG